jgi:hypothetical protein
MANTVAGQAVRVNILNMSKFESLYAEGMRPVLFSQTAAALQGVGWTRCGENVRYYPTNRTYYQRLGGAMPRGPNTSLYTLSFTVE